MQIDRIDRMVSKLETNAYRLDAYTKQLRVRIKELDDNWIVTIFSIYL